MTDAPGPDDPAARIVAATWSLILDEPARDPSVRRIAAVARVNPAMVCYYFENKDGLLATMFFAYLRPLVERRAIGLAALAPGDRTLETILSAWCASGFDEDGATRYRALSRMLSLHHAPLYRRLFTAATDDVARRFIGALADALPGLTIETVACRFYAVVTALMVSDDPVTMASVNAVATSGRPIDRERWIAELASFAAAGFRAPPP